MSSAADSTAACPDDVGLDAARQLPDGGRRRHAVRRTDSRVHAVRTPRVALVPIAVFVFPIARQRPTHAEPDEREGEPRLEHDDPQSGTHWATPSLSPR